MKDLALHLLDDDLGWLSRGCDGDRNGLLAMDDHESFVQSLNAKNQRWIDGAQGMSAAVITDLLQWAGEQLDAYYASMDLQGEGHVSWAGDGPVPVWFDIAQDLTERWVHQMQLRRRLPLVAQRRAERASRCHGSVLRRRRRVRTCPAGERTSRVRTTFTSSCSGCAGSWSDGGCSRSVHERQDLVGEAPARDRPHVPFSRLPDQGAVGDEGGGLLDDVGGEEPVTVTADEQDGSPDSRK